MKLEKLTQEQEILMEVVANEWISIALGKGEYDEKKIEEGVKCLYRQAELKEPLVLIVDSPLACQLVANSTAKVREKVGEKVRKKVGEKVWEKIGEKIGEKVWEKVGEKVGEKVWEKVGEKIEEKVRKKVWEKVRKKVGEKVGEKVRKKVEEKVRAKDLKFFNFSWDELAFCAGWVSFYDFFQRIGILKDTQFSSYKEKLKVGNFMSVYLDGLAIVSLPPKKVEWLENNLHSLNGPAIVFRDEWELFYINDVEFEEELYWKIVKQEISAREVIELENIEQRTIALETLGYEKVLKELGGKVLHSEHSNFFPEKQQQVIEVDLKDDDVPAIFFKFVDSSTGKSGVLRVNPREIEEKTCKACSAWTFGLNLKQYNVLIET